MSESVGSRLKKIRIDLKLTLAKVGQETGYTHAQLSRFETGKAQLSTKALLCLSRFYGVAPGWLETGEGEREYQDNPPRMSQDTAIFLDQVRGLDERRRKMLQQLAEDFERLSKLDKELKRE